MGMDTMTVHMPRMWTRITTVKWQPPNLWWWVKHQVLWGPQLLFITFLFSFKRGVFSVFDTAHVFHQSKSFWVRAVQCWCLRKLWIPSQEKVASPSWWKATTRVPWQKGFKSKWNLSMTYQWGFEFYIPKYVWSHFFVSKSQASTSLSFKNLKP